MFYFHNLKFEYRKGNNALLLGNGLNNLDEFNSWSNLLKELDPAIKLYENEKSFPLAFEQIVLSRVNEETEPSDYTNVLGKAKNRIVDFCKRMVHGEYHERLRDLDISTFLTTNYDYMIERSFDRDFAKDKLDRTTNDYKYSLRRYREVDGRKVWHIHGEIDNGYKEGVYHNSASASIMIGHEHYGDYYRRIHQYLRPFDTDDDTKVQYTNIDSWVPLFFNHNIHIAGYSLDSSEFHLWWLLALRARLKKTKEVNNSIYYHFASYDDQTPKQKAKGELLQSFGVNLECITIDTNSHEPYREYWKKFFHTFNDKYLTE